MKTKITLTVEVEHNKNTSIDTIKECLESGLKETYTNEMEVVDVSFPTADTSKLPPCQLYARLLQIASFKFNMAIDQCRNKYGLFTIAQWNELLDCQL